MTARPLRRSAAGAIVAILAIIVLAADQFVKYLTITHPPYGETFPVLGDFFQLHHVTNPGAAFSLGSNATWIFTIALAVVAAVIVWKAFGLQSRLWAIVLGCLLGGVLGNLGDRLFREPGFPVGHVVDMLSMPWMLPAIFNVADIFIVTGMISVALLVMLGIGFDGVRDRNRTEPEVSDEVEAEASHEASSDEPGPSDPKAAASSGSAEE